MFKENDSDNRSFDFMKKYNYFLEFLKQFCIENETRIQDFYFLRI